MGTFYSTVDCEEESDSRAENIDLNGFTASVVLRVPYANRYLLAADLLTNARTWPHIGGAISPVASSIAIAPAGFDPATQVEGAGKLEYDDALLTVTYANETKDLIAEEIEPTVEFSRLDHRHFRWSGGDPLLEPEAPGRQIRGLNFNRTYYLVTAIPVEIVTLIGFVNDDVITASTLGITFAAETLLYEPGPISRTISTDGVDFYTVQTRFSAHPISWNKYWRPSSGAYEEIVNISAGTVYKNYPLGDFTNLMTMPQG